MPNVSKVNTYYNCSTCIPKHVDEKDCKVITCLLFFAKSRPIPAKEVPSKPYLHSVHSKPGDLFIHFAYSEHGFSSHYKKGENVVIHTNVA